MTKELNVGEPDQSRYEAETEEEVFLGYIGDLELLGGVRDYIDALFAKARLEITRNAKDQALLEAASAVCGECEKGDIPVEDNKTSYLVHRFGNSSHFLKCEASKIHDLRANHD